MKEELIFVQNQIGYNFNNTDLLNQAIDGLFYSEEKVDKNNEELKLIGDKVLEFFAVKLLVAKNSNSESLFQKLVHRDTLAKRMDELGLNGLIAEKCDFPQGSEEESATNEALFKAILGAVAVDCNWDAEKMQTAVEIMLFPDIVNVNGNTTDYISLIKKRNFPGIDRVPLYRFEEVSDYEVVHSYFNGFSQHIGVLDERLKQVQFACLMKLSDDYPVFRGFGQTKAEARRNVCKLAYEFFCEKGLWCKADYQEKEYAVYQLETLARRGYFSPPVYDFEEVCDKNRKSVWRCTCSIKEEGEAFTAEAKSQNKARISAAYEMVKFIMK